MNLNEMITKCIRMSTFVGKSFKVVKVCYNLLVVVPFEQDVEGQVMYVKEVM